MDITPSAVQNFIPSMPKRGLPGELGQKQSPREETTDNKPRQTDATPDKQAQALPGRAEALDKINSTNLDTLGAAESVIASQAPDRNEFFLQQKNFAYLPINRPKIAPPGGALIEQNQATSIATFLQIARPSVDVRLIDTYV